MTSVRLAGWALAAAVLVSLLAPEPAAAHAVLVRSEPADASSVSTAPRELRLVFNEPVRPEFTRLELRGLDGTRVPTAGSRVRGREVQMTVPALRRGTYVLGWTVMAVGDAHVSEGVLVFGAGTPAAAVDRPSSTGPRLVEVVLRWLDLSLLAVLVGSLVVATLVLGAPGAAAVRRRALVTSLGAGAVALSSGAALLAWQAWRLADESIGDSPGVAVRLLGSSWGAEWAARQTLVVALIAVAFLGAFRRLGPRASLGAVAVIAPALAVVHALSGHANGLQSSRPLAVAVDAVHLLAAAVWIGGLVGLTVALRGARRELAYAAWRRFGALAAIGVGVLVASGLYLAGRQVASLDALGTTLYGRTLLVKGLLLAIVGALGLANLRAARSPRAERGRRSTMRLVIVEAAAGLLVVLGAGVLTAAAPARGPEFAPAPTRPPDTRAGSSGDLLVSVRITPNRAGENVYDVRIVSTRRPAPAPVRRVRLRFRVDDGRSVTTASLRPIAPDRYRLGGSELRRAGAWVVEAVVERPGLPAARVGFEWSVGAPGTPRRVLLSDRPLGPVLVGAAAVVAAVLLAFAGLALWLGLARPRGPLIVPTSVGGSPS